MINNNQHSTFIIVISDRTLQNQTHSINSERPRAAKTKIKMLKEKEKEEDIVIYKADNIKTGTFGQ